MSLSPSSNSSEVNEGYDRFHIAKMPLSAVAFLLLSALIQLCWSHYQLMWTDEFYTLETAKVASIGKLIHLQLTAPISIDTVTYNLMAHATISLLGATAFAIRLPSMCGYLLMQICLFYFVRRIATERAAIFALAFPALVGSAMYGIQARPYGLLLGLAALAIVSWQTATRHTKKRTTALVVLSISVALVINTHFYGVLLLVPLCGTELFRTFKRKQIDRQMILSLLAGMTGIIILVPFASAVSQFRTNYFMKGVNYHFITHSYLWMLLGYEDIDVVMQHLIGVSVAVLVLALMATFIYLRSEILLRLPSEEVVLLLMLAALPIFGYVLAYFVTKVIEGRYILPALIGITALVSVLFSPLLQKRTAGRLVLASMFLALVAIGVFRIRSEKQQAQKTMASLLLSPSTQFNLSKSELDQNQPIYVTNPAVFQEVGRYAQSANIRSRISLVYSRSEEMSNQHNDYLSITAANMRTADIPNIVPYGSVAKHGTTQLFVLFHNSFDWTDHALGDARAEITCLGHAFGGDLVVVRFP